MTAAHDQQQRPADRDRSQPLGDPEEHDGGRDLVGRPRTRHRGEDPDVCDLRDPDRSRRDRDHRHDGYDGHRGHDDRDRERIGS